MSVATVILWLIIVFNIFLAFAIVFLERKNATSTWAWLMVLLFIPVAGFLLYLTFGRRLSSKKLFIWDNKSKLGVQQAVKVQLELLKEGSFPIPDALKQYHELFYLHLRNDDAILTQDNEVAIFTDGQKKFDALIADMEQATDHIHMIYYIIRDDKLGQRIADTLIRKAQEGVKVRFLFDDMGSRSLGSKYINKLKAAGVEVESFFPPLIPKVNFKINHRNHRKLAIIDGTIGYIGGYNIGDEYLGDSKKFGYWRDTHLRIVGGSVRNMQTRYILDWNQASKHDILYEDRYFKAESSKGDVGIQIVSSGPDSEWEQIKNGYIKMIMEAKEFVYIQTPYFIPDESLADAVRIAVLSGVDVRIMIPNKPDHPFVYWATYSYVGELLRAGASIYIYQNGFLHAKTIVVDGKIASVGTANIDVRSFRLNFEVNAFLYSEKIGAELVNAYHKDLLLSTQLTLPLYQNRSLWIRFKESIARLIAPIL